MSLDQCLNENIFKPKCVEWATRNPLLGRALRRSYCTADNMLRPECRAWVSRSPGQNVAAMTYFCQQQPFDSLCGDRDTGSVERVDSGAPILYIFILILIIVGVIRYAVKNLVSSKNTENPI